MDTRSPNRLTIAFAVASLANMLLLLLLLLKAPWSLASTTTFAIPVPAGAAQHGGDARRGGTL